MRREKIFYVVMIIFYMVFPFTLFFDVYERRITIDGVKVKYPDGFALVRASNTGPNITMRFEAKTEERLNLIKNEFTNELNKYL